MNSSRNGERGFSLLELALVIAILAGLLAWLLPTLSSARSALQRAQTRVRFQQWALAVTAFRQEYGYYPQIDDGANRVDAARFAAALMGRAADLAAPPLADGALGGNVRRVPFYRAEADHWVIDAAGQRRLCDAFGNTDIAVLYDHDGDGVITPADGNQLPAVEGSAGRPLQPDLAAWGQGLGVTAEVWFYSAGRGRHEGDLVGSHP